MTDWNDNFMPNILQDLDDVIQWKHFPRYSPFVVTGGDPSQSFDVFFDLGLSKRFPPHRASKYRKMFPFDDVIMKWSL